MNDYLNYFLESTPEIAEDLTKDLPYTGFKVISVPNGNFEIRLRNMDGIESCPFINLYSEGYLFIEEWFAKKFNATLGWNNTRSTFWVRRKIDD